MYVVLSIILLVFIWAVSCLGQKTVTDPPLDQFKRRLELREEMHRRMREKLLHGIGPDTDLFQGMDQLFEDAMKDSLGGVQSLDSHYQMEWLETKTGRTLVITPKNPKQQLDIDIQKDMISIKGKSQEESSQGRMVSDFSNTFSVPDDCDGGRVKINQKDGKILIELPFKSAKPVQVPIPPTKDGVEI